jgi:two-component system chemotaxis sensor kinase CheA
MSIACDDDSFIKEALPAFISEAHEQVSVFEQLLLQLESTPGDRELLDALFRCAHTIKGSAGIFGLDRVVAFAHHVETLLDLLREGRVDLTSELSTLLLRSGDQIRAIVSESAASIAPTHEDESLRLELVRELGVAAGTHLPVAVDAAVAGLAGPSRPDAVAWHVCVAFGAETFRNGMDPLAILDYVRRQGHMGSLACNADRIPGIESIDPESCLLAFEFDLETAKSFADIEAAFAFVRDDCVLAITACADSSPGAMCGGASDPRSLDAHAAHLPVPVESPAAAARSSATQRSPADDNRFIRVHADRLDDVINLLGELVIASAGASLLAGQTRQRPLIEANQHVTRLIEEIRNGTLQLRMVPIGETFARFRRVVRDTAAELGKDVALEIVGGDTELDKSVVERIADPLTHLVRNALDHGLEAPAERLAVGKSAQGRLTLSACHDGGGILIRIADDGRGIQRDKVLARAWERGLVERGVVPPDAEILRLVFEPGFSTAQTITNLSGRGVGMDVVRRNIEALRGTVTIASEPGSGASVEIRLPLTLAIIEGFMVSVGPSKFIFPLDAVIEVIKGAQGAAACGGAERGCVDAHGHLLPVVDLRALYALDSTRPERSSIVVIRAGGSRYGVVVDALLGQHQTVIKPLGRMFRSLRGMSGSAILGSGEVALIFDVNSLGVLAAGSTPDRRSRPAPP